MKVGLWRSRVPVLIASLIALTFLLIGCLYIVSPVKMIGSFGLKTPSTDAATLAWLRLKGIRDFACALMVAVLLLTTALKTVGIVLILLAVIPFGDMANVLASDGRKSTPSPCMD